MVTGMNKGIAGKIALPTKNRTKRDKTGMNKGIQSKKYPCPLGLYPCPLNQKEVKKNEIGNEPEFERKII